MQWLLVSLCVACGPSVGGTGSGSGSGDGTTSDQTAPPPTVTRGDGITTADPLDPSTGEGTSSDDSPATSDSAGTESSSGPGCDPHAIIDCGGTVYACGNGIDDDGDGLVDLEDPECVGPCDDTEAELHPALPGDGIWCGIDCGFDGNLGQGDDGCHFELGCDPLEPASGFCGANPPPPRCADQPQVPKSCLGSCEPLVPNGCDCFGCCAFEIDGVIEHHAVYEGDWQECRVDNLQACPLCTPQLELCGNPCEVDQCEVCFGQTAPPEGCEAAGCVGATACESTCDCAEGEYCHTGCCHPVPPG